MISIFGVLGLVFLFLMRKNIKECCQEKLNLCRDQKHLEKAERQQRSAKKKEQSMEPIVTYVDEIPSVYLQKENHVYILNSPKKGGSAVSTPMKGSIIGKSLNNLLRTHCCLTFLISTEILPATALPSDHYNENLQTEQDLNTHRCETESAPMFFDGKPGWTNYEN